MFSSLCGPGGQDGGRRGRKPQVALVGTDADWINPPEFADWDEYEAAMDQMVLQGGASALAKLSVQ